MENATGMGHRWLTILAGFIALLSATVRAQLPHPLIAPNHYAIGPSPGVRLNGDRLTDQGVGNFVQTGSSTFGAGDFDGDGDGDILIGAPGATHDGGQDRGETFLVRGSETTNGGTVFELADVDGTNGCRFQGYEGTLSGGSISGIGDVNADGRDDFLIGFPPVNDPTRGEWAYLIYGFPQLPGHDGVFNLADLDGSNGVRISADAFEWDYFARRVAGGSDVNGDGYSDFAIASWDSTTVLLYGSPELSTNGSLEIASLDGTNGVLLSGALISHMGGVGDVNGDGIDDFAFGSTTLGPGGNVVIAQGSLSGIGSNGQFDLASPPVGSAVRCSTWIAGSLLGATVGSGDVNGDGIDDILIGSPGPVGDPGKAFCIYGSEDLFSSATVIDVDSLAPEDGLVLVGSEAGERIAIRIAGGDVNGDGFADLLFNGEGTSRCYVVYGSPQGVSGDLLLSLDNIDGQNGTVVEVTPPAQRIVSVGDHNGDGISDFLISWNTGPGSALPGELPVGECYLFYGQTDSLHAIYRTHIRAGDAPPKAVGALGDGSQPQPSSRCWIDHEGGQGPGVADASLETVTLTRTNASIEYLASPELMADVMWTLTTDRVSQESTFVRFHYITSEVASLEEIDLRLYHASDPTGPWEPVLPMGLSLRRNEIAGRVTTLSASPEHFAIAATGGPIGVSANSILDYLLGLADDPTDLDVNLDRRVNVADLTTLVLTDNSR